MVLVKLKSLSIAAIAVIALSASAWACHYVTFEASADCNGWAASGSNVVCGSRDTLAYIVNLKQGETVVATFAASFVVWATDPTWSFSVPWGMELCGDYVAEGHFYYISPGDVTDHRDFSIPFTCECEEGACHYTPGYWKNHPEAWPVTSLTVGCVTYNQADLLVILGKPVKGDATIILAHHLIAAKLNVANGADDSIAGTIAQADNLLCSYPLYSKPANPVRSQMLALKDALCAYNEYVVPGCEESSYLPAGSNLKTSSEDPSEESSWGAIKSIYR